MLATDSKLKTIKCVKRHMLMKCCYTLVLTTEKVILVCVQYNDTFFQTLQSKVYFVHKTLIYENIKK